MTFRSEAYIRCCHCGEPMHGILDMRVRATCEPCGGSSLIAAMRRNDQGGYDAIPLRGVA